MVKLKQKSVSILVLLDFVLKAVLGEYLESICILVSILVLLDFVLKEWA